MTKGGVDSPQIQMSMPTRSAMPCGFRTANNANGIERIVAIPRARMTISAVTGSRADKIDETGWALVKELPRWPVIACVSQCQYRVQNGSSRCNQHATAAISAFVAPSPARTWALPPGRRFISEKIKNVTPHTTGTA